MLKERDPIPKFLEDRKHILDHFETPLWHSKKILLIEERETS